MCKSEAGHVKKETVAPQNLPRKTTKSMTVVDDVEETMKETDELSMFAVKTVQSGAVNQGIWDELKVDDIPLTMELDTRASVSVVSEKVWKIQFNNNYTFE